MTGRPSPWKDRTPWPREDTTKRGRDEAAAAALLVARDVPPPCSRAPHLFDGLHSSERVREAAERWQEAEALCKDCPLLEDCQVVADGFTGVAAGGIYGIRSVPNGTPPSRMHAARRRAS
ncbi:MULTISPECIES: hypothetical protein [Rhodococcus]|uniref:4Fe-4S Wbl-type domain-containing protein n=1 Tax=Rhodococcus oxybenzonivorans TaxID=1990687 RepID=A0AAE4UW24_9NOCA|nr:MULTISPECIES: hypothetical protein [Rhodococcus]MDV7245508.1 hypothetical protein [Rhodococcus oxybenzonivorans]MDV7263309.1 hypothetical protein [Rhodococcus oxybenzonivorans]MDV7276588.1 hypothetical protein [Rhodococcus oxybenzonivorans]MDV7336485.1 hypothetical protein [Rhodococcus oxybenzonivorans]MDV7346816.1 hypothetical protein [Rhodococcus oxybenzonivorans]